MRGYVRTLDFSRGEDGARGRWLDLLSEQLTPAALFPPPRGQWTWLLRRHCWTESSVPTQWVPLRITSAAFGSPDQYQVSCQRGVGSKGTSFFFFLISEQYHSSLSTTVNTRAETMDWPPRVHLFKHLLFVISSIIQTAVMGFWQICFWNGDIVFKITLIGLEVGAPLCLFGTS